MVAGEDRCHCPPQLEGPDCQQTRLSFLGDGHAWFPPIRPCFDSHLSLEFMTEEDDGLLLYAGPVATLLPGDTEDYMAIELISGTPSLKMNHGSGTLVLQLTNNVGVADRRWHRLDVRSNSKEVRFTLDRCSTAIVMETEGVDSWAMTEDRSSCEIRGVTPNRDNRAFQLFLGYPEVFPGQIGQPVPPASSRSPPSWACPVNLHLKAELYLLRVSGGAAASAIGHWATMVLDARGIPHLNSTQKEPGFDLATLLLYLNGSQVLQLGGVSRNISYEYPQLQHKHFTGCIRNLLVDTKLYDLGSPAESSNTVPGCSLIDDQCSNMEPPPSCGKRGRCHGEWGPFSCLCEPGFTGPLCDQVAPEFSFDGRSHIQFQLSWSLPARQTRVQLGVRTRAAAGVILSLLSQEQNEYLRLEHNSVSAKEKVFAAIRGQSALKRGRGGEVLTRRLFLQEESVLHFDKPSSGPTSAACSAPEWILAFNSGSRGLLKKMLKEGIRRPSSFTSHRQEEEEAVAFTDLCFAPHTPVAGVQVIHGLLAVFYNLGDGDYNITLPFHRLNDGEWHDVALDRYGREFTLQLDGGGGRREVTVSPGRGQEIIIDPSAVMIGNSFPSGHNRSFLGCLRDVRFNGRSVSLDREQPSEGLQVVTSQGLSVGCSSDACRRHHCSAPLVCVDLWRHHECRCPPGHLTKESSLGKACVYTLCASRPCRHGTCVAHSPARYSCHCSEGYRGRHCEVTLAMFHNEDGNSLSLSSMFAISICVMAFLGSYVDYVLFYLW
ncbi:unnamed protein product [Pleuronectes platessa]|uniref:Uncharacterized protein n=1 Tax=Pleuronectes platessa TaxID=8262 RepID=A0A9N7YMR6_PLEPL|nr:unnamed protein product [Pleuronectes platessa]